MQREGGRVLLGFYTKPFGLVLVCRDTFLDSAIREGYIFVALINYLKTAPPRC